MARRYELLSICASIKIHFTECKQTVYDGLLMSFFLQLRQEALIKCIWPNFSKEQVD